MANLSTKGESMECKNLWNIKTNGILKLRNFIKIALLQNISSSTKEKYKNGVIDRRNAIEFIACYYILHVTFNNYVCFFLECFQLIIRKETMR